MPDLKETLTRKIGPLPVWAWGGVVGGGVLIAKALGGGGGASSPFQQTLASADPGDYNFDVPVAGGGGAGGSGTGGTTPTPLPSSGNGTPSDWWRGRALPRIVVWPRKTPTPTAPGSTPPPRFLVRLPSRYSSPLPTSPIHTRGGDTYAIGDTTPGTPIIAVPSMPPQPIGNVLTLPIFGGNVAYGGPTVSAEPIASSARVVMPPLVPSLTGSVARPVVLPSPSGRPAWTRALDPLARVADRLTPDLPGTTARPRLAIADAIETRVANVTGKNASG